MTHKLSFGVALICMTALAGCFGSGGGSGTTASGAAASGGAAGGGTGGGGGSLAAFDSAFNAANGKLPTLTALTGTGSYTGQVKILTGLNQGNTNEAVVGDLNMDIDFDANSNPISAEATNFAGQVNGQNATITGTLSTANAQNQVNAITASTTSVGTVTGMSVGLEGTLTDPTGGLSGDALMTLQGTFKGTNGETVNGAAGTVIRPSTGANVVTGGTFYANR